jgi:acyl-CoA synthetase (NDP forming)
MNKDEIFRRARNDKRAGLTEIEAKEILKGAGIPVVETRLAKTITEAVNISKETGFPVVMKIVSPDVLHKSDSGGVKLDVQNSTQVRNTYREIISSVKRAQPKARIEGIAVQKMARPGIEVIIGMSKDAQFGPVLMFGLGGIMVEILKDVSFRVVPLTRKDAHEMITEIKGYPVLEGYRGQEPADIAFLENLLVKVSEFIVNSPDIKELDLNPIFAYKEGAVAVDARIILES